MLSSISNILFSTYSPFKWLLFFCRMNRAIYWSSLHMFSIQTSCEILFLTPLRHQNSDSVTDRCFLHPHPLFLLQSFGVSFSFSPAMPVWLLAPNSWAVIFWQACTNTSPSLALWRLSLMDGVLESTLQENSTTQIWGPHPRSLSWVSPPVVSPASSAQTSWKHSNWRRDVSQWYVSNTSIHGEHRLEHDLNSTWTIPVVIISFTPVCIPSQPPSHHNERNFTVNYN